MPDEPIRVLLADDHPVYREGLAALLASVEGLEVVGTAADGAAALRAIEREHPDIILLDMKMPVMDGWEFARRYRERYGETAAIIVVTAAQDAAQRSAEIGADDFLAKPFDLDTLTARVAAFAATGRTGSP